jgi:CDGSH-type Zn-finger protein
MRGYVTGKERDRGQDRGYSGKHERIGRPHAIQHALQQACEAMLRCCNSQQKPYTRKPHALTNHKSKQIAASRSQSATNAQFTRALAKGSPQFAQASSRTNRSLYARNQTSWA